MNRASSTNGHTTESVLTTGGYDAYFAQIQDPRANQPGAGAGAPGQSLRFPQAEPASAQREQPTPAAPAATSAQPPSAAQPPAAAPQPSATQPPPSEAPPGPASNPAPPTAGGPHTATTPPTGAREQPDPAASPGTQPDQARYASSPATPMAGPPAVANQGYTESARVPDRFDQSRFDHGAVEPVPRVEVLPPALSSLELFADISAAKRAQLRSNSGMRGALNKVGFKLGLSPAEQRAEDRRARIRRQLNTSYQIAVVSVKGGVGRTTMVAALGSTFSGLRPDRVVAVDANPDFGDLSTRTVRHPYGLTLRDLAQAQNLDAFSAVHAFTTVNSSDLAVVASPWNTEATEALSGPEYMRGVEILRKHYNLLVVDCGTGVLDSATASVLRSSDAVLVVTPATVGGVTGAVATLNWLSSHGLDHLVAQSIVAIVHHAPLKPTVEVDAIEKLFATAQRPTRVIPFDPHLAEGGEIDLRLLDKETVLAFEDLAADLADGFPSFAAGAVGPYGDRGGWR
ncbi:MinD/ParA family ATP-binding protein [Nocardia cyriacigeorgica]|uniref:MinD/ParA family ATP-binding protein n=1 Tax=Nocardia cyriacigeorgica TaxID=135487 RepID=UPI0002DF8270|nr:MinD/ParA family protein [Nocardia cyriacigeorgica]